MSDKSPEYALNITRFSRLSRIRTLLTKDIALCRYACSGTLCLIISSTAGYSLSHLTPMLALLFIGKAKPPMSLKKALPIILMMFIIGQISLFVGYHLIVYPLVILLLLGLAIFWMFRLTQVPEPVRLLCAILLVVIPFTCLTSTAQGEAVMQALIINLMVALSVISLMFILIPYHPSEQPAIVVAPVPAASSHQLAITQLAVVLPVVASFYLFNLSAAITSLIFVIILSFDPLVAQSKKTVALLIANLFGGLLAIAAYNILVMSPNYLLYVLISLAGAFYFALGLFSTRPMAPVYHTAFNTFVIILGLVSTSTGSAGQAVGSRVIFIGVAIIYVVTAFKLLNYFRPRRVMND